MDMYYTVPGASERASALHKVCVCMCLQCGHTLEKWEEIPRTVIACMCGKRGEADDSIAHGYIRFVSIHPSIHLSVYLCARGSLSLS